VAGCRPRGKNQSSWRQWDSLLRDTDRTERLYMRFKPGVHRRAPTTTIATRLDNRPPISISIPADHFWQPPPADLRCWPNPDPPHISIDCTPTRRRSSLAAPRFPAGHRSSSPRSGRGHYELFFRLSVCCEESLNNGQPADCFTKPPPAVVCAPIPQLLHSRDPTWATIRQKRSDTNCRERYQIICHNGSELTATRHPKQTPTQDLKQTNKQTNCHKRSETNYNETSEMKYHTRSEIHSRFIRDRKGNAKMFSKVSSLAPFHSAMATEIHRYDQTLDFITKVGDEFT
jgi:hypothetical protein